MALVERRRAENVPGDFYVDSSCIDCDLCRQIAPEVFAAAGDQSYLALVERIKPEWRRRPAHVHLA